MATLIDIEDERLMVISSAPNDRGWELVEVRNMEDMESAVVIISIEGG